MEEDKVVIWGQDGPAMIYRSIADQFGLKQGQRIETTSLFEQIIDQNTNQSRAACSIQARALGEECASCGS